ncbi:MAG TPA: class 1 isoprenoid biosynthesis enzyme [Anaerolineales bacterium]
MQTAGKIQEWLDKFWLEENPDSAYNAAISTVLSGLWNLQLDCEGQPQQFSLLNLPCVVCSTFGGEWKNAVEVNAAWLLLYAAFYVLDKIEDQEVDNIPSTGLEENVLINVTTGLILNAGLILSKLAGEEKFDLATLNSLLVTFNRMALKVCAGQHVDLTIRVPDLSQVWQSVAAKSGDFFALACWIGARAATDEPDLLESMTIYGRHLGILIQIANDIEGLWGKDGSNSDLANGKVTLPVAFALSVLPPADTTILKQLILAKNKNSEASARRLILSCGGLIYLMLEAEKHRQQAKAALNGLPMNEPHREELLNILDRLARIAEDKGIKQVQG